MTHSLNLARETKSIPPEVSTKIFRYKVIDRIGILWWLPDLSPKVLDGGDGICIGHSWLLFSTNYDLA
jgi:hypothetical protein